GLGSMFGAAMPETTVHEYRKLMLRKGEIWLAFDLVMATPAGDAVQAEEVCECYFGVLIAFAPDAGHDLGAFLCSKDIGHVTVTNQRLPLECCMIGRKSHLHQLYISPH